MNRRPRFLRRAAGGFTLLEVLVAVALLVILCGALYGGLRVALRSWDSLQQHGSSVERERFARNWLTRLIGALQIEAPAPGKALRFEGREDRLRFVAALPALGRGGLYVVEIVTEDIATRTDVVLELRRLDPEADELAAIGDGEVRRLVIDAPGVRFDYFGTPKSGEAARWHRRWADDAVHYPVLVRLAAAQGGGGGWVELLVPVRGGQVLAGAVSCPPEGT